MAPVDPVDCTATDVDQTLTTNKATYNLGDIVTVTASLRNRSATACTVADPDSDCYVIFAAYITGDNRAFWRSRILPIVPCRVPPRRTRSPGAMITFIASWDQTDGRECSPYAPGQALGTKPRVPGRYTIVSAWLPPLIDQAVDLV